MCIRDRSNSVCSSDASSQEATYNHKQQRPPFTMANATEVAISDDNDVIMNEHDADDDDDDDDNYNVAKEDAIDVMPSNNVFTPENISSNAPGNTENIFEILHKFQSTCKQCGKTANVFMEECPLISVSYTHLRAHET